MDFEDSYPSLVWERPFWSPQYYDLAPRHRPPSYCDRSIMTLLYYDHPVIMTTPLLRPPCYFTPPPTPSIITSPILSPPPTLWPPRLYLFFSSKQKYINFSYSTTIPYSYTLPSLPLYYHSPFGVSSSFPHDLTSLVLQLFQCLLKDEGGRGVHFYLTYFKTSRADQRSTNWRSPAEKKRNGKPPFINVLLLTQCQNYKRKYCWTSLIRTPKGQSEVSALERCPFKRGHYDDVTFMTPLTVLSV